MSWKVVFEICLCDTDRVNIDFVFEAVFVTLTELILTVSWKAVFVTLTTLMVSWKAVVVTLTELQH